MRSPVELKIVANTSSVREAEIIVNSVLPEVQSFASQRSKVLLHNEGPHVIIEIIANDLSAARASINGVLRWVAIVNKLIDNINESENRVKTQETKKNE